MACVIRGSHDKWNEVDRERLKELARVCRSDRSIARIMERRESAIGWQRRKLRIRLEGFNSRLGLL